MNHDATETTLSAAGLQRRDAMRDELLDAFAAMTRTRRNRRRASIGAGVALVGITAVWVGGRVMNPVATPVERHSVVAVGASLVEIIDTPANRNAIEFALVDSDTRELVKYVQPNPGLVRVIDDSELIETLAQMNRPAGLIEVGNRVRLTRDVVDDAGSGPGRGSRLDQPLQPGNSQPSTGV